MSSISLLRPDEVPDELICAICFSIPLKPKLLPCEHVFCANCIRRALETQASCPTCRSTCSQYEVRDLSRNPFAFRIWNSVQVKCDQSESGCAWTGSIGDLESHQQNCSAGNRTNINQEELERLQLENIRLKDEIKRFKEAEEEARAQHLQMVDRLHVNQEEIERLKRENTKLKNQMKELEEGLLEKYATATVQHMEKEYDILPKIDHSNYSFNRHNVVKLAQLISRYLEDKPNEINSNRIYNCVQSCYRDLETGYSDNPKYYYMDMHMLLTTCAASTWFTDKQRENIRGWLRSYFS